MVLEGEPMTEETMNRFRNRFLILAIGLAALSAASSRAQAQGCVQVVRIPSIDALSL